MILAMGVGWLLFLFFLGGKKRSPSTPAPGTEAPVPGPTPPLPAPKPSSTSKFDRAAFFKRIDSLADRTTGGLRWVPLFLEALRKHAPQLPEPTLHTFAEGLGRWAGIESGGKPRNKSGLGEIGLLQIG